MRKILMCLFVCVLSVAFAAAQTSSASQSAQQPSSSASSSSQSTTPQSTTPPDQNAATSNQQAAGDRNAATANQNPDKNAAAPSTAEPAPDNQPVQQAQTRDSGVPWGWILLGIAVVAIILALIGRGSDRSERVERTDVIRREPPLDVVERDRIVRDRDDDIRRVG